MLSSRYEKITEWRFDHLSNSRPPIYFLLGEGSDLVNRFELKQELIRQIRYDNMREETLPCDQAAREHLFANLTPDIILYVPVSNLLSSPREVILHICCNVQNPVIIDVNDIGSVYFLQFLSKTDIMHSHFFLLPPFSIFDKRILLSYLKLGEYWNMNFLCREAIEFSDLLNPITQSGVQLLYKSLHTALHQFHQSVNVLSNHKLFAFPYCPQSSAFRWRRLKRKLKVLFYLSRYQSCQKGNKFRGRVHFYLPTDVIYLLTRFMQ